MVGWVGLCQLEDVAGDAAESLQAAERSELLLYKKGSLLVFLERGAGEISTTFGLNESFSEIITGIIIFFIIGSEFFLNYQLKFREKEASK